jgi:chromosome segregation ATPase
MDPTRIDAELYTRTATEIRRSQPALDPTTAFDMSIELQNRQERERFHAAKVEELAKQVDDLTAKWQKLNAAVAAAGEQLTQRPWLRADIAEWKHAMDSIEEDGAALKKTLQGQENLLKAARKALKQLNDKNPIGFDYTKFERLKQDEAALNIR